MSTSEREAMLALALLAAMADGASSEQERAKIKSSMTSVGSGDIDAAAVYENVLTKRTTLEAEAARISPQNRVAAFEAAVAVCDADGATTGVERELLDRLARALQIPSGHAAETIASAEKMTIADIEPGDDGPAPVNQRVAAAPGPAPAFDAEAEKSIRNQAILCGAIELMPQSLASMAIIPLQMRMVYAIGKTYGYSLDTGHIKDLLATVGVGMTSQFVEGYARRLFGGLVGSIGKSVLGATVGGMLGGVGTTAVGAGITFATTYALGKVAHQYYGGGRKVAAIDLQALFSKELASAKATYEKLSGEVVAKSQTLKGTDVMAMVRSNA